MYRYYKYHNVSERLYSTMSTEIFCFSMQLSHLRTQLNISVSFLLPFFLGVRVENDISVLQVYPHNYGKIEEELLAYFPADIFMPGAPSSVLTIHLYYANPLTLLKPTPFTV